MLRKFLNWPLSCKMGLLVVLSYTLCTIISVLLFPNPFNPITNWLSDLGNYGWSPIGAIFYNMGCIVTGVFLFPFFIGLKAWYQKEKWTTWFVKISQVIGILSAVSLILIGIFSEDFGFQHMLWSAVYFLLNFFLVIIGTIIVYSYDNGKYRKYSIFAFGVVAVNFVLIAGAYFLISSIQIFEWITVFSSLAFVALIVLFGFQIEASSDASSN